MKAFEANQPNVPSGAVDKEEGITVSQTSKAVSKDNIDMDLFEGALWAGDGVSTLSFQDGGKITEHCNRITTIDELGILGRKAEILVVTEAAVAK